MATRFVVLGGGFYGACTALFLRSISQHIILLEREKALFTQASFANQARIHAGFHYPRSFATAKRSVALHRRFLSDFASCVQNDFRMLYAIARSHSNITAKRFREMFRQMGAPIRPAAPSQRALFRADMVEEVFDCYEPAFDAIRLRDTLLAKLHAARIDMQLGIEARAVDVNRGGGLRVTCSDDRKIPCDIVINATYARLNHIGTCTASEPLPIKNELAEIALVDPPRELEALGITVMDGPFFSCMPFPARDCYSLTHVRYTPQLAWHYRSGPIDEHARAVQPRSRWLHMVRDAARFVPCLADVTWRESLFVIKAVLSMSEVDDGRPILLHPHGNLPGLYSVLGGKIDNIYDLFAALPEVSSAFACAKPDWVFEKTGR